MQTPTQTLAQKMTVLRTIANDNSTTIPIVCETAEHFGMSVSEFCAQSSDVIAAQITEYCFADYCAR